MALFVLFWKIPPALTHSGLRLKVCWICLNECGKKPCRKISKKEENYICRIIILGYSSQDRLLPIGICDTCHLHLIQDRKNGICRIEASGSYNLIKRTTRSVVAEHERICTWSCIVCKRGQLNGLELKR